MSVTTTTNTFYPLLKGLPPLNHPQSHPHPHIQVHTVPPVFGDHHYYHPVVAGGEQGKHVAAQQHHCRVDLKDLLEKVGGYSGCGGGVYVVGQGEKKEEVTVFVTASVTVTQKEKEIVTEKGWPTHPGAGRGSTLFRWVLQTADSTKAVVENPLLNISVDLLGLPIDVEFYLDIANGSNNNNGGGLLGTVTNLVGGLLGDLLGGSSSSRSTIITDNFTARCSQCITGIVNQGNNSGSTGLVTAADAQECLQLCQRAGILFTVQIGELNDCLGVTLRNGVAVDNCLYLLGAARDILDLNQARTAA
ncbi:hypothetical protein QBC38DRAFT_495849 [Podospora fimiseda]|uniref:Uncharacterized protein n=1 Tax=Podospora fimiseda TaxID=252190 RepID=A0AAN7BXG9_9PEZI|nr:hypothetical protein QBC38DRAFT_495849 [Podospora fimiseda]